MTIAIVETTVTIARVTMMITASMGKRAFKMTVKSNKYGALLFNSMDEALFFQTRADWRDWLSKNHAITTSVWLFFFKKSTGKKGITLEEAVEEAICFGWIDGKVKSIDHEKYMQRFTPRREKSGWSKINVRRYVC